MKYLKKFVYLFIFNVIGKEGPKDQFKIYITINFLIFYRYNDYQHDEFSRCKCNPPYTAEAGISTRGDLNPSNGTYELAGMGHRDHGSLVKFLKLL